MPLLPNIGPLVLGGWTSLRQVLPSSCSESAGHNGQPCTTARSRATRRHDNGGENSAGANTDASTRHLAQDVRGAGDTELQPLGPAGPVASSSFDDVGERMEGQDKIDEWQAGWNVTNAIQGMFIVSLPYTVLHGGYWAIVAMVGVAHICCYTGKILVDCLYEEGANGESIRVRNSYVSIAKMCFGARWGGRVVNTAQLIELLMTCILYVVLCGDLMIGMFPQGQIDTRSWMMLCGMLLIPCGFLKNLHHVSTLSFWCTMAHLVINIIIFGYCFSWAGDWAFSKVKLRIDMMHFPIGLGIIVFSYTSQIFLPSLEGNMKDPGRFDCMLDWSHIAAAVFKSLFGYIGYLTWQDATQEVITNNLPSQSFKQLINFFLVIKALLSYPLPYYAACELLEHVFFKGRPYTYMPSIWAVDGELRTFGLAVRIMVVIATIMMAVIIPHFAILMGFIGSITGVMLSFIWPCYFHLKLKWDSISLFTRAYDMFIIFLGFLFGFCGIYTSGNALVEAYRIGLPF